MLDFKRSASLLNTARCLFKLLISWSLDHSMSLIFWVRFYFSTFSTSASPSSLLNLNSNSSLAEDNSCCKCCFSWFWSSICFFTCPNLSSYYCIIYFWSWFSRVIYLSSRSWSRHFWVVSYKSNLHSLRAYSICFCLCNETDFNSDCFWLNKALTSSNYFS